MKRIESYFTPKVSRTCYYDDTTPSSIASLFTVLSIQDAGSCILHFLYKYSELDGEGVTLFHPYINISSLTRTNLLFSKLLNKIYYPVFYAEMSSYYNIKDRHVLTLKRFLKSLFINKKSTQFTTYGLCRLTNLTTLHITDITAKLKDSTISSLVNLTSLELGNCKKFRRDINPFTKSICRLTNASIQGLTKLKRLYLEFNPLFDDNGIKDLTNLTSLSLREVEIRGDGLFGKTIHLKELEIQDHTYIYGATLRLLSNSLVSLSIGRNTRHYWLGDTIEFNDSIGSLTNLTKLHVDRLQSRIPTEILLQFTNLTDLCINGENVTNECLRKWINLKFLDLQGICPITYEDGLSFSTKLENFVHTECEDAGTELTLKLHNNGKRVTSRSFYDKVIYSDEEDDSSYDLLDAFMNNPDDDIGPMPYFGDFPSPPNYDYDDDDGNTEHPNILSLFPFLEDQLDSNSKDFVA